MGHGRAPGRYSRYARGERLSAGDCAQGTSGPPMAYGERNTGSYGGTRVNFMDVAISRVRRGKRTGFIKIHSFFYQKGKNGYSTAEGEGNADKKGICGLHL